MPPILLEKNRGDRWFFAYAKVGVQICFFMVGWAVHSPDQWCKSFVVPILHILDCWIVQSPICKFFHVCQFPWQQLAYAYSG